MSQLEVSRLDTAVAVLLLLTLLGVQGVLVRTSSPVDRVLALGLSSVLLLAMGLLVAVVAKVPLLEDVVLVLAVLGAVALSSLASRPRAAAARDRTR